MDEMMRRIVDIDRQAQDMLATAQREKLNAETLIEEKTAQLKENYLDQARRRIRIDTENDRTLFEQRWKKRQKYFDAQLEKLQRRFKTEHDQWLETIVSTATKPAE